MSGIRVHHIRAFNRNAAALGWPMRIDEDLPFESPALVDALAIWRAHAVGAFPSRASMTPRVLKSILTKVALFDVVREEGRLRFRVRVIGSDLALRFGNLPGTFIDEVVPSPFRERWQATLKVALDVEGPVRSASRLEFKAQSWLHMETLLAPLAERHAPPDAVFIAAHFSVAGTTVAPAPAAAL